MRLVWGTVRSVITERPDAQRLRVTVDGESDAVAVAYPALAGRCEAGERVLLNTTAVDLGLGTGGVHLVVARVPDSGAPAGVAFDDASGGHVMKLRYTPLQRDVLSVEAPESPHAADVADVVDVGGMPVICCGLHSQVALAAAALKEAAPDARVAYCMTDQAALPLALSELVPALVSAGLLDTTLTCGQAFGGQMEAVTLHSALVAARVVGRADATIVAIGPGVVGTGSALGHGGVALGEALNAAAAVGGKPVATLRVSFADARERHRGVSHHTLTALSLIAVSPALIAVPRLPDEQSQTVGRQLEAAGIWDRHERMEVGKGALPGLRGVDVRSMGRTPAQDPAFFVAAAAAGYAAAARLSGRAGRR